MVIGSPTTTEYMSVLRTISGPSVCVCVCVCVWPVCVWVWGYFRKMFNTKGGKYSKMHYREDKGVGNINVYNEFCNL